MSTDPLARPTPPPARPAPAALGPAEVTRLIYYAVLVVSEFGLLALLGLFLPALVRPVDWPVAGVMLGLVALLLGVLRVLVRLWEMVCD